MGGSTLSQEQTGALWHTLEILTHAPRYRTWIFSFFAPYIGSRVLEVGCGMGHFTALLLQCEMLVPLDVLPVAVETIARRWGHLPHVHPTLGDFAMPSTVAHLAARGPFDTVLFLNVLEHIEDDAQALRHAYLLLRPGGYLLLYVPAGPGLFGTLDTALGHYRRYTRESLLARVTGAGFDPVFCQPVNALGALAWWFDGHLRRYTILPLWQVRLFNTLVPILRPAERVLRSMWPGLPGLSLACVARKPITPHTTRTGP